MVFSLKHALFILFCFCTFCNYAQSKSRKAVNKCQSFGKVRDYSNAVDCGYLIENEEGTLLLPLEIHALDPSFRFGPDQILKFDFKILENTSTMCMVEAKSAEFTCLKLLPSYPIDCLDVDLPEGEWMSKALEERKPHTIRKFMRDADIVYVFDSPEEKIMFDCTGRQQGAWIKKQQNKCKDFPMRNGRLIYQWEKNLD